MKGTLIVSTPRSALQPLAVQGIPVPSCHAQIVDIVRSRLGEAHVLLFAEPMFDEARAITDWYTPVQGTPTPLAQLDPATQHAVCTQFAAMAEDIRLCVKPLMDSGDKRNALSGEILDLSLHYPDVNALYLVGKQPVVTCWGCGPVQAGVEAQDLARLAPLQAVPAAPAVLEPLPVRYVGILLPWILALLGAVLLALFLWAWNSGALRAFFDGKGWLPQESGALFDETLAAAKDHQAELLAERDALRQQVIERRSLCVDAPKKQQSLAVPEDTGTTGDLSFLAGAWICDGGLADSNNVPLVVIYTFDAQGKGIITIEGTHGVCTAEAQTALGDQGSLKITAPTIVCPDGASYHGQELTCTGVGGKTRCTGRNTPGSLTWEANFYRK